MSPTEATINVCGKVVHHRCAMSHFDHCKECNLPPRSPVLENSENVETKKWSALSVLRAGGELGEPGAEEHQTDEMQK